MAWGENLTAAIEELAQTLSTVEAEWDVEKMQQKFKEYFNKAAKKMVFRRRKLEELINEYTENAMGSVFAGLGDREWLTSGQADFLMVLDAGIKDHFPANMLANVNQLEFEQQVLTAYDKVFEENRFGPILWEAVPTVVSGPKIKRKVTNAVEAGRTAAIASGTLDVAEFAATWINAAIKDLSENSQGNPEYTMSAEHAVKLFVTVLEGGGIPLSLQATNPSAPVHVVEEAITNAYAEHTVPEDQELPVQPKKKKQKTQDDGAWGGGAFDAWGADPAAFNMWGPDPSGGAFKGWGKGGGAFGGGPDPSGGAFKGWGKGGGAFGW